MSSDFDSRNLFQQLTLAVIEQIDSRRGVYSVKPVTCPPAGRHAVLSWEQRNGTVLPDDLKQFYLTNDGIHITWSVKMGNGPFQLGKIWLNPVSHLTRIVGDSGGSSHLPSLADLEDDSDEEVDPVSGRERPRFNGTCKLFELDPCDGYGKVCLVYKGCKSGSLDPRPEVWFLDRALSWHYLASSFTAYYRLMLMHMGLPQWQYAFTDFGLSAQAKQWFQLFAPLRLELDLETHLPSDADPQASSSTVLTQIDATRLFKAKTDKKKQSNSAPAGQAPKKKAVAPGNKTPTGKYGSSSTQSSIKSQR